jgi:hypothetical protein
VKCFKCGGTIYADDFCPRCGSLKQSTSISTIPGIQGSSTAYAPNQNGYDDPYEEKVKRRRSFRKGYRITLIAAVLFLIMDLYQNSLPEADHLVDVPWPFIFQATRILAMVTFILTLIIRTKAPMLYFIWAVTVVLGVRFFAVIYKYGVEAVTLTEWIWGAFGLTTVASFWILKYGVQHRIRNW